MLFISHRGNLRGIRREQENTVLAVNAALDLGYHVEVDIRWHKGWYLGHDFPGEQVSLKWLMNDRLWIHAKTVRTLNELNKYRNHIHSFFIQRDRCVWTSWGYIWTPSYRNQFLGERSIIVLPENTDMEDFGTIGGICSDYIESYRQDLDEEYYG